MKKLVSILLCLVMVLGLLPMAAFAADTDITVTVKADKTTAAPGDTITYTVSIGAVTNLDTIAVNMGIPDGLTVGELKNNADVKALFQGDGLATAEGIVFVAYYGGTGMTSATSTVLGTFTCTVDANTKGNKTWELVTEDKAGNQYENIFGAGDNAFGVDLKADVVNVPKTSYVPPYALTVSYGALTITDTAKKTVEPAISGKDAEDDDLSAEEMAKVTYAFKGTAPAGLSIDAKTGVVTVSDAAAVVVGDSTVTVTATLGTATQDATIAVNKAAPAIASVVPAASNDTTALIPADADSKDYTYAVEVKDQYGAAMDVAATWEVVGTLPEGVIFDATTAKLTVPKTAAEGKFTLKATVGDKTPVNIEVSVTSISFSGQDTAVKATAGVYGDKLSDMVKINGTITATAGSAVAGTYTLVDANSVPDAGDVAYQVVFNSTDGKYTNIVVTEGTVTVAKKPVTVTVNDVTVKIGADMPELTDADEFNWTASELVGDDEVTGTASYDFYALDDEGKPAGAVAYGDITSDEAAEYAIVVTGLSVTENYVLDIVPGTLTIRKKNLSSAPIGQGTQPVQTPDDNKGDETKGTFEDVTAGDWFYDAVEFVADKKLFNGTSATTFSPNTNMTRAMVATVLYRLDGENKTNVATAFEDVVADTWYSDGVAWAAEQGVVTGYSEAVFAPDDNVTREQLAAMLYRYAGSPEVDAEMGMAGFGDVDAISEWAGNAMRWAVKTGIINGKEGGRLDPAGNATRAEVAAMLQRFVEKVAK